MSERSRPLALAAVSAAAAAGCCRLFGDAGWIVPVVAAVGGAHAVGALTARRPAGVAAAVHTGGLAVLLAISVGGHTAYGLPTPATVTALARALGRSPEALRAAIVPAPTTPELILPVVAGLWIATAVADGLARRRRAGLLAALPLAVFPVVVAALGTGHGRALLTFAFAAAVALYAGLDRAGGLPTSEARMPGRAGRRARRAVVLSGGSALATVRVRKGRAVGPRALGLAGPVLAAGAAAVVLGPLVPGIGRAVVDVHHFGVTLDVTRVELNPLVDIQPQLLATRRTELFTVRATAPAYWRLTALDRFDGRRWSPSRPALFHRHGPSGEPAAGGERALHQDFRLTSLDSPWLPAADRAVRVRAPGARLDPETDSLVTKKGSRSVRAYGVESRLPVERTGQVPTADRPGGHRAGLARYLALPDHFPREVRELAERFTAGAATPYDRAVALEDSLRVGFIYDETAPPGASIDALEDFLFGSRRGYCEQFAGAYAAMARALGLPARVAVGFTPGTWDGGAGVWRVTTREAHAWPEVFLEGVGWMAFEPTPGRVLPDPEARMRPDVALQRAAAPGPSAVGRDASALARIDPGGKAGFDTGPGGRPGRHPFAVTRTRALGWLGAAAFGLLLLPPAAKTRRRRVRRRARGDDAVLAAWREALDRLSEAGVVRRVEETPLEFALRAGAACPGAAPALQRLAVLVNVAAYSPPPGGEGPEAWAATGRVVRALDAHDPAWVRLRRRLDPRPLLAR
jgi:transglutaminase-like putative cysteine protease